MAEIGDEELSGVLPKVLKPLSQEFLDIGYYKDENGYTRFGVIPKPIQLQAKVHWDLYDGGNVTSNPNFR